MQLVQRGYVKAGQAGVQVLVHFCLGSILVHILCQCMATSDTVGFHAHPLMQAPCHVSMPWH